MVRKLQVGGIIHGALSDGYVANILLASSYVSLLACSKVKSAYKAKASCQAMAALLLANIHAPHFKPAITLTDLKNTHSIFWLDGLSIMYYAAPNAATAWALTKALLAWDLEDHSNAPCKRQLPQSVEPIAKRQKLDVHAMRSSGGELAQLAMISDSLSSHKVKRSTAACMVKQLFNMPAFCSEERLPSDVPFGMYS